MQSQEQWINLYKLPYAEGAAYNSRLWEHEDQCLPDTRVELHDIIRKWWDHEDPSSECIFWLNGMAGTGKSTISRTVARELAEEKRLAASFFFSRGQADISHAGMFFTTIAAQLANNLPVLRQSISDAINQHLDIFQQGLREQWQHLILDPLKNAPAQSIQLVVVIDALDECYSEDDIQLILQLLAEARHLETIRLRVFVTSRPETPILLVFRKLPGETYQDFVLHDIPPAMVNHDISIFFQEKLSLVKADNGLSTPWPDELTIQRLVEKVAGLFIYAGTIYRFIREKDSDPEKQLSLILGNGACGQSLTKHLDEMYTKILQCSISGNHQDEYSIGRFQQIVGSIVVMFDVMAVNNLANLLNLTGVTETVASLRSVLNVPACENQPIRIFNPSFRDFLLDSQRCLDSRFWIAEAKSHILLFQKCMELISELRQDLCNLREPGILLSDIPDNKIQQNIPTHILYACRYWLNHLQQGNPVKKDYDQILHFLKQYFLCWIEALALVGEVSGAVLSIIGLETTLAVSWMIL